MKSPLQPASRRHRPRRHRALHRALLEALGARQDGRGGRQDAGRQDRGSEAAVQAEVGRRGAARVARRGARRPRRALAPGAAPLLRMLATWRFRSRRCRRTPGRPAPRSALRRAGRRGARRARAPGARRRAVPLGARGGGLAARASRRARGPGGAAQATDGAPAMFAAGEVLGGPGGARPGLPVDVARTVEELLDGAAARLRPRPRAVRAKRRQRRAAPLALAERRQLPRADRAPPLDPGRAALRRGCFFGRLDARIASYAATAAS